VGNKFAVLSNNVEDVTEKVQKLCPSEQWGCRKLLSVKKKKKKSNLAEDPRTKARKHVQKAFLNYQKKVTMKHNLICRTRRVIYNNYTLKLKKNI